MTGLHSPFPYFGGKRKVAPLVWERFGDVPNYCEPFAGSLAVLLGRPSPAKTETVNDVDAYLANFWRAVQHNPEAVAHYANWPVNEVDLHARHLWLVNTGRERIDRLLTDPDAYDVQVAGWWVWGICQWIGSGWCSGKGPHRLPEVQGDEDGQLTGVSRQLPHLSGSQGVTKKLPHLADSGRGDSAPTLAGIERKRPSLINAGRGVFASGVAKQLPHVGGSGRGGHRAQSKQDTDPNRLIPWMQALADRLRYVRVCCGDWSRILGPSVTFGQGITGVFLDPPYSHDERDDDLYRIDHDVAADVRAWAIANGENPLLRIALCGYEGEHEMPDTWRVVRWKATGGYGSQGQNRARDNASRECVWFSKACLVPGHRQPSLFEDVA